MNDERLRELERRFNQTGARTDLEALMYSREQTGDLLGAAQAGRNLLDRNPHNPRARALVAKHAPLLWTGTVSCTPLGLAVREGPLRYTAHLYGQEDFGQNTFSNHAVDMAYAHDTLSIVSFAERGLSQYRTDITPDAIRTSHLKQLHSHFHVDHVSGAAHSVPIIGLMGRDRNIHSDPENHISSDGLSIHRRRANEIILEGPDCLHWVYEDRRLFFRPREGDVFNEGPAGNPVPFVTYRNTHVPTVTRLARKENRASSEAHLASIFGRDSRRSYVEVPLTILNNLYARRES